MKKIIFSLILFLLTIVLISGCVDVKRDIKIYPNGTGTENVYVTLSPQFYEILKSYAEQDNSGNGKKYQNVLTDESQLIQTITADFQKASGTQMKDIKVTTLQDGSKEIHLEYIFDNPQVLFGIVKTISFPYTNKLNVIWSTIKFLDDNTKLNFKWIMRKADRSFSDSLGQALFSPVINSTRTYINLEMPFTVYTSNAHSQSENVLRWDFLNSDILLGQVEMTAEMERVRGIDLPFADKPSKEEKVSQNVNPMIRVQIYNANQEPVKIVAGIIVQHTDKADLIATNFSMMNLVDGGGFFSVRRNDDSLAGIDDMKPEDLDQSVDLVFLRFNNNEKVKPLKWASLDVTPGQKVKIFYYPNALSPVVYSLEGTAIGLKKWKKNNKILEIKPSKPLSPEGGAIFNENGEFMGLITKAYEGEVGRIYAIPSMYIKTRIK
jgi:hypothetical protein